MVAYRDTIVQDRSHPKCPETAEQTQGGGSDRALPGKTLIWYGFRHESGVFVRKSGKTAHIPNGSKTAGNPIALRLRMGRN